MPTTRAVSRLDDIFGRARAEDRTLLMPFLTAGYPSIEATDRALPALERAGASIVELGVPFSDPIADGPVIAASMHEALGRGVRPRDVFDIAARARAAGSKLGLVSMVSSSIVERNGPERYVRDAAEAGFDGLIVPDLDTSALDDVARPAAEHGLALALLVAPTTSPERAALLARHSTGFIYLLARVGITGERKVAPEIAERVALLRRTSDLPIAAGFGISTAEHVRAVTAHADAAIVGSAIVRAMGGSDDPPAAAAVLVRELARGLAPRGTAHAPG